MRKGCPFRDGVTSERRSGMTYITLKLLKPDLDLLDVVANTTNHRLE